MRKYEEQRAFWIPRRAKRFKVKDKPRRGILPEILLNPTVTHGGWKSVNFKLCYLYTVEVTYVFYYHICNQNLQICKFYHLWGMLPTVLQIPSLSILTFLLIM